MSKKTAATKFTIKFSETDPSHLFVVDLLNRQGRRSKAPYIVNAILHFVNCEATPNIQRPAEFDESYLKSLIKSILQDNEKNSADNTTESSSSKRPRKQRDSGGNTEDENAENKINPLRTDKINAIAGSLKMFDNI